MPRKSRRGTPGPIPDTQFLQEPQLVRPSLIAAWPGVGNVALRAVSYLREKLGAEAFATIAPLSYFDIQGVFIDDNLIQLPRFPENKFYFWRSPNSDRDLIIFQGDAQPSYHSYELAHRVIEVAQHFGAQQAITLAAALVAQPVETSRVWATATDGELLASLEPYGVVLQGDFFVAGLNGLLLAVAKEKNMAGICLLGETFRLLPQVDNPVASLAVLRVLTQYLGLTIDLREMEEMAERARQEMSRLMMESQKQFLDRFTVPLWEKPDEEERA